MFARIRELDQMVVDSVTKLRRPWLDRLMIFMTHAGTAAAIWWVTLVIPMIVLKTYRWVGVNLGLAFGVTYVIGELIIKHVTGRDRPSTFIEDEDMMVKKPRDYSFPSGHTASSFTAFSVTLLCCPWWVFVPVFIGAALIGFSRVYLRVHYLSDVVVGALLGIVCGIISVLLFKRFFPFA